MTIPMSEPRYDQLLDAVLRPIHEAWVRNARRFVEPALDPGADFWTHWAAVRYLSDDFREQYRLERALVDGLRPTLPPRVGDRLVGEGDMLLRRRLELDRIGRRRGTAAEMAAGTRDLLDQLGAWLAEIERAAAGLSRGQLTAESAAVLAHLEAGLLSQR